MKNLSVIIFLFITVAIHAQDAKYMSAMQKNVASLDSATLPATYQNARNAFERIANANPKEWLPLYYQAYCDVMTGMQQSENNKKDEYYDMAEQLANRADSLSPNNSEIVVLQSLINSMKISVDPMSRGQKLGMKSAMMNERAITLDKNNPRAYLMKGSGLMYTPEQFGGGKEKAIPVLEVAVTKYKEFKPTSPIMPHWGQQRAEVVLEQCKKPE